MPVSNHKALVQRYYDEVVSGGNFSNLEQFISPVYLDHNVDDASARGPDVLRQHLEAIRKTFPDFSMKIEEIITEGNKVVTRVTGRGTHLGEWMGIIPTGKEIYLKGINIDTIEDGKIVEHRGEADTLGMLVQMGLNPFGN